MSFANADPAGITDFHAHIYYDPAATRGAAERLRQRIAERFTGIRIGSLHDELVGPHLMDMFQLVFAPDTFAAIVPWLMLNREGLDILVHPSSGDTYTDHIHYGLWLGNKLLLNEPHLRRDFEAAHKLRMAVASGAFTNVIAGGAPVTATAAAAKNADPGGVIRGT